MLVLVIVGGERRGNKFSGYKSSGRSRALLEGMIIKCAMPGLHHPEAGKEAAPGHWATPVLTGCYPR